MGISGRLLGLGGFGRARHIDKLGPDAAPRGLTQVPPHQFAVDLILDAPCFRRVHVPSACQALVEVLLVHADLFGDATALGGQDLLGHGSHHSDSLAESKRIASRHTSLVASTSLDALHNASMETASSRRKRRLQELCDAHGGFAAVAEKAKVSGPTLDQILKGTLLPPKKDGTRSERSLGAALAAKIEGAFNLPRGWFDVAVESEILTPFRDLNAFEAQLVTLFRRLPNDDERHEYLVLLNKAVDKEGAPASVLNPWASGRRKENVVVDFERRSKPLVLPGLEPTPKRATRTNQRAQVNLGDVSQQGRASPEISKHESKKEPKHGSRNSDS